VPKATAFGKWSRIRSPSKLVDGADNGEFVTSPLALDLELRAVFERVDDPLLPALHGRRGLQRAHPTSESVRVFLGRIIRTRRPSTPSALVCDKGSQLLVPRVPNAGAIGAASSRGSVPSANMGASR